jgi:hypothetical protein
MVSARRRGRHVRGSETWSCARNPKPGLRPAPEPGRRARGRALGLAWLLAKVRRSAPVTGSHTSTAPFFPADASESPAAPRRPPFSRFTLRSGLSPFSRFTLRSGQSRSQHRARSGCAAAALRRTQAPSAAAVRGCGGRRRAPCGEKARAKMSVLLCNHRLTCSHIRGRRPASAPPGPPRSGHGRASGAAARAQRRGRVGSRPGRGAPRRGARLRSRAPPDLSPKRSGIRTARGSQQATRARRERVQGARGAGRAPCRRRRRRCAGPAGGGGGEDQDARGRLGMVGGRLVGQGEAPRRRRRSPATCLGTRCST